MGADYGMDWIGKPRKWKVVQALAGSKVTKGEELTFDASGNLRGSVSGLLGSCTHNAGLDQATVVPTGGGSNYLVKRKICLIGPDSSGTGASWVAEEGG
jgi:hypothetical protein